MIPLFHSLSKLPCLLIFIPSVNHSYNWNFKDILIDCLLKRKEKCNSHFPSVHIANDGIIRMRISTPETSIKKSPKQIERKRWKTAVHIFIF